MAAGWRRRIALGCCATLILAGTIWATSTIVRSSTFHDGFHDGTWRTTVVTSDDPSFTEEKAEQVHRKLEQFIARGEGELVKVKDSEDGRIYVYRFALSDGSEELYATDHPLRGGQDLQD